MAGNNLSLGIDFRQNQVILCLLQKAWPGIRLVDYQIKSWKEDAAIEDQLSFISNFVGQYAAAKDKVFLAIPREKTVLRFLRLPMAAQENLRQVVEYEAPKYLPYEGEEICFDYQIVHQDREGLDLLVLFSKKREMANYLSLLERIGLKPQAIMVSSLGALNLFHYHGGAHFQKRAVLIELQDSKAEINFLKAKWWYENFLFSLPAEKKEEKIIQVCQMAGVMEDEFADTNFYIYGPALEARTPSSWTDHPAFKNITYPRRDRIKTKKTEIWPVSIYASVGVPLPGLIKAAYKLNLLPGEKKKRTHQLGKPFFIFLLCLTILLALSWVWGSYRQVQNELHFLRTELNKRRPEVATIENLKKEREKILKEIAEFKKLSSREVRQIDILQELSQILPPTVWIWNLKITGGEVEISGFADSASDLLPLLDRSPLFEKVEFLAPVTKERDRRVGSDKEKERFKIRMHIEKKRL